MSDWKVGDKAVEVLTFTGRGSPRITAITITKVARKWVSYQADDRAHRAGRFGLDNNRIDGGNYSSPGRVYRSEDEYRRSAMMDQKWAEIRKRIPLSRPLWLSDSDLDLVIAMFRLSKETGQ